MSAVRYMCAVLAVVMLAGCRGDEPEWVNKPCQAVRGLGEMCVEVWDDVPADIKANLVQLRAQALVIRSQRQLDDLGDSGALPADGLFSIPVNSPLVPIDFSKYTLLLSYNVLDRIPVEVTVSMVYNTVRDSYQQTTTYVTTDDPQWQLADGELCIARNAVLAELPPDATVTMVYATGW